MFESPDPPPRQISPTRLAPEPPSRLVVGLAASCITAATLVGLLLGFGRRYNTLWRPLNAAAFILIGARADDVWGFQSDVTPRGVAVVLVVSALAGVATAGLTSSRRTFHRALSTFGIALVCYLVHVHIVARTPGGLAALLALGELRTLYAAVAIALFAGMRYAFSPRAGAY